MGEKIKYWLEKPLFIYVFGFAFLIYRTSIYLPSFQLSTFLFFGITYCAINYLLLFVCKKIFRTVSYFEGLLLAIWVYISIGSQILFNYKSLAPVERILLVVAIIGVWTICSILQSRYLHLRITRINKFINVFIIILSSSSIIKGAMDLSKAHKHDALIMNHMVPSIPNPKDKDIVWILMDEYASPAYLRNDLHFKNDLIDSLKKNQFFVFDSLPSRENVTLYSVSSLFNLDDSIHINNYMYAAKYLNESKWMYQLHYLGYDFVNLDFFTIFTSKKLASIKLYYDNYLDQIFRNSSIESVYNKIDGYDRFSVDAYNQMIIQKFKKVQQTQSKKPRFIWTHLLIPHPIFYRNPDGSFQSKKIIANQDLPTEEGNKAYLEYLKYGNNVVLEMLNQIPDWKHKMIVISGDHGFRQYLKEGDARQFATFAAIYSPDMDTLDLKTIQYLQQIPLHLR